MRLAPLRCDECLRPLGPDLACRRHPWAGELDLTHEDDAAYAASVRLVQRDGRGRRWTTLGWSAVLALMGGFILRVDAFGNVPLWLEGVGLALMVSAGAALAACLTAHAAGALRALPGHLRDRKARLADRRDALDDPALEESARDLDRARLARAAALVGFVAVTLLMQDTIHAMDAGHHDLRGLQGMPTASVLAALTAVGGLAILATPLALVGKWLLRRLGRGPELEPLDATGLVDVGWELDFFEPLPAVREQQEPRPLRTPVHAPPGSGWE